MAARKKARRDVPPARAHGKVPSPATTTIPRRLRFAVAGTAFVAAFLERWWFSFAWHEAGSLSSAFYYGDAQRLVEYAMAIAQRHPFDNGIPYHPPGWPILLAGFLGPFGAASPSFVVPVAAVKALLAVLSAAAVAMTTLIAFEISGFTAMLVVAILAPFHFGHIVEGTVADTEALYGLCVAIAMFATLRAVSATSRRPVAWTAVAGAVGGYAMIVRAEFVACAVVLAGCIMYVHWRRTPVPRTWLAGWLPHLMAFAAVYVVVLVPTTVWHWRTIDAFNRAHVGRVAGPLPRFAPVTSYGPFNFAMANHENADGGPNRDHPMLDLCNQEAAERLDVGQLDLACPAVYDLYVHGYRVGLAWMASHPLDAAALVARKFAMTSGFLAQGYMADDLGAGVTGTRRRVDLVDPDSRFLLPIHLGLAIFGLWVLRRKPVCLIVVCAPLVALVLSTALFYGYVRLGTSYLPAIWALQGSAIAALNGARGMRNPLRSATIVGGIVVVLLAIDAALVGTPREVTLDGPRTDSGVLIQDETVRVER